MEKSSKIPSKRKGVFCIVLAAFFYSLMSLFVRMSGDLPVYQKSFFRNLVAAFVAFILLAKSGNFKIQKGSLPALLGRSIAGTVGIVCNFYAIDHMNISDASILNKLAPFFSVLFSIFILKEKASWKEWLLVGVAFSGAVIIARPSFGLEQSFPAIVGVIGGLGAGLAYTFVRYLGKRGERKAMIVFFFSAFSCLAMLPMVIFDYQPMTGMQVLWLLLAGGAASGAQFSVTAAYSYAPAKDISVYDYSQVLFAAVWGALFLSQFPDWWSLVGYAVIIGAAVVKWLLSRDRKVDKTENTEYNKENVAK
ncbi:MAG: DMT family transporter [Clostridia bacterium]|nr:DMT family transporter [Clostridia bacterium]